MSQIVREATSKEISQWDKLVAKNPDGGAPLQSKAFGEAKSKHGWKPRYVVYEGTIEVYVMYLTRSLRGFGELWYAPNGPGVRTIAQLRAILKANKNAPLLNSVFLIRYEPRIVSARRRRGEKIITEQTIDISKLDVVIASRTIQTNLSTVLIDIDMKDDALLDSFESKTRYSVRLAIRKGVTIEQPEISDTAMRDMYGLMQATSARTGYYLREYEYFKDFWTAYSDNHNGQFFFARYQGQIIAGAFFIWIGRAATYKDAGLTREKTELGAPTLLLYEAMKYLKTKGTKMLDLHGAAPLTDIDNPDHPLIGITRYKMSFRDTVTEYMPSIDQLLKPAKAKSWQRLGEKIAMRYSHRVKKQIFY